MRSEPTFCRNATQYEADQGKHLTWDDDAHCTVCRRTLDKFAARRADAEQEAAIAAAEHATWAPGVCSRCHGKGVLGPENDAHPSVHGMRCTECEEENDS